MFVGRGQAGAGVGAGEVAVRGGVQGHGVRGHRLSADRLDRDGRGLARFAPRGLQVVHGGLPDQDTISTGRGRVPLLDLFRLGLSQVHRFGALAGLPVLGRLQGADRGAGETTGQIGEQHGGDPGDGRGGDGAELRVRPLLGTGRQSRRSGADGPDRHGIQRGGRCPAVHLRRGGRYERPGGDRGGHQDHDASPGQASGHGRPADNAPLVRLEGGLTLEVTGGCGPLALELPARGGRILQRVLARRPGPVRGAGGVRLPIVVLAAHRCSVRTLSSTVPSPVPTSTPSLRPASPARGRPSVRRVGEGMASRAASTSRSPGIHQAQAAAGEECQTRS
ncbi:hypothetical protein ACFFX0_26490 [Citricoccus parietis]|uniref:Uncharacterized protein n=1 Tax=Citricoccus parietis TaxID=592307 RepID=A0ABV5G6H7_9MICC